MQLQPQLAAKAQRVAVPAVPATEGYGLKALAEKHGTAARSSLSTAAVVPEYGFGLTAQDRRGAQCARSKSGPSTHLLMWVPANKAGNEGIQATNCPRASILARC